MQTNTTHSQNTKVYKAKTVIPGVKVLGKDAEVEHLVAVPVGRGYTHVDYKGTVVKLGVPISTQKFKDKYGRGDYELAYYKWNRVTDLFGEPI